MAGQDTMRFMQIYNALRDPQGAAQTPRVGMPQPGQAAGWMGGAGQMSPQDIQTMQAIRAMMARQQNDPMNFNPASPALTAGMSPAQVQAQRLQEYIEAQGRSGYLKR